MRTVIKRASLFIFLYVIAAISFPGCEKQEPQKEQSLLKEPVALEKGLYKQCKIAFSSKRDGNYEIYTMNADGSRQTRLTNNSAFDANFNWSPDGEKISFSSQRDGNFEVYKMNHDGTEQTNLTNNPAKDLGPHWSADGKKLAFPSIRNGNSEIYVMNPEGSEPKRLTNNPDWNGHICWSPDGKKIAYVTIHGSQNYREGNLKYSEIHVMNADGSGQKRLTNNTYHDSPACWSPDGQKIAFLSDRDGNSEIYVMNADGLQLQRLTNNPEIDTLPSWSPDGKKIAFVRYNLKEGRGDERFKNAEIYIMNADGSGQTRLTYNAESDLFPSWSPDGQKIVFYSKRDSNYEIYIMNPDGSDQTNLTKNPADDVGPTFSPLPLPEN